MDNLNDKNNEIDIIELISIIWSKKHILVLFFIASSVISVTYALSLSNKYQSSVIMIAADNNSMDSALSQYGGLASLAGVSIPQMESNNNAAIGLEVLKSKQFVQNFIEERDILVPLMASEDWDPISNQLIYDEDLYDTKTNKWLRKPTPLKNSKPSFQEAYEFWMKETFSFSKDIKSGVIYITIKHFSPNLAQQWASWFIEDLNTYMREIDVKEAERSIDYLDTEVQKTTSDELRLLIYNLIQSNTETKMLAYSRKDYVFRVIDPPQVPIEKVSPNRQYISIIGSFLGTLIGVLLVFLQHYLNKKRQH